jgi:hypothetical protein
LGLSAEASNPVVSAPPRGSVTAADAWAEEREGEDKNEGRVAHEPPTLPNDDAEVIIGLFKNPVQKIQRSHLYFYFLNRNCGGDPHSIENNLN